MRYINTRFTYLLTYLLTSDVLWSHSSSVPSAVHFSACLAILSSLLSVLPIQSRLLPRMVQHTHRNAKSQQEMF